MFAGLPGIGVGTLFYVLIAVWMPFREIPFLLRGQSSLARWGRIVKQLVFSAGIMASIAAADRMLAWWLGPTTPRAVGPARWINDRLGANAPHTVLAAPIMASLLLLASVLLAVEVARVIGRLVFGAPAPVPPTAMLPSAPTHPTPAHPVAAAERGTPVGAGASLVAD